MSLCQGRLSCGAREVRGEGKEKAGGRGVARRALGVMPSLGSGQRLRVDVGAASVLPGCPVAGVPRCGEQPAPCLRWGVQGLGTACQVQGKATSTSSDQLSSAQYASFLVTSTESVNSMSLIYKVYFYSIAQFF